MLVKTPRVPSPPPRPITFPHFNNCTLCQHNSNFHFSAVEMFAVGFTEGFQPQCVPCGLSQLQQYIETHIYSLLLHSEGLYWWPRGLGRGSAGYSFAGIVGSRHARGMDACLECCVLSGRDLCVGLITRLQESYRLWCV